MFREKVLKPLSGYLMLVVFLAVLAVAVERFIRQSDHFSPLGIGLALLLAVLAVIGLTGLFTVQPNDAKIVTLFGKYIGTVRDSGFHWINPFTSRRRISLRVRNFETAKLKVNDASSNPIEIGAIVVWKVVDSAEAAFEVDDYQHYVQIQSEAALRALASSYPYDAHKPGEESLSTHTAEVSKALLAALHDRLQKAGVECLEARISHLAYSPEIASAMLRRQQASAIIAARQKIVEGAVGMVENALALIGERGLVHLDDERKAQMVSNLLVVLCSDRDAQPVVNAGTLYQ